MQHASIYRLFREVAGRDPDKVIYRHRTDEGWNELPWSAAGNLVSNVARALIACGVGRGDRVGILSVTRLEWVVCDFGIVTAGAATVGVYPSSLADDCAYILDHAGTEVLFVENDAQLAKILAVRDRLPRLRLIVTFLGKSDPAAGVLGWSDFLARAADVSEAAAEERGEQLGSEDLASIVYTSGTTGVPKGVMLTHGNLLFTIGCVERCLDYRDGYTTLLFLPLAHVFARMISYCCMANSNTVSFCADLTRLAEDLREVRPHFIVSVPRVYEKFHDRVLTLAETAGGLKLRLFEWAIGVGIEAVRLRQQGRKVPLWLRTRVALADRLALHKVRAAFGGRLAWAVSGAAPLNKSIGEFFGACDVPILEGIGMTENTSFTNVNRLGSNRYGTVGPIGPGIEMRVADDGEVLFRGPNVMKGYYNDPEATREAIDEQGWLHTGDVGEIDEDGYLRITDRKKDLIVTAGGKNVAPQRIERFLTSSRFIAQAMAYGDRRKFITALIVPDLAALQEWAARQGLSAGSTTALLDHPRVRELIAAEVESANTKLASFETVKRFHLHPRELTVDGGELTPTLKLKRKVVVERYGDGLERLYR